MIPRIIHYCWFGGKPLPEDAVNCISSWRKYCPDYKIIEWNESNTDINACEYAKEASEAKKWAFLSDYVRLVALVKIGGIYMDTDVEVIKPLDEYLELRAFSGFETDHAVPTGIMACEKGHPFFERLLMDYNDLHFVDQNGNYDLTTNVTRITTACVNSGLILNNTKHRICDFTLFPKDYFCPLNHVNGELEITANTHTIHWFAGSWKSEKEKKAHKTAIIIRKTVPGIVGVIVSNFYEKGLITIDTLNHGGVKALLKRVRKYNKASK